MNVLALSLLVVVHAAAANGKGAPAPKKPKASAAPTSPAEAPAAPAPKPVAPSTATESAVVVVVADDDLPIHRRVVTGFVVEARATVVEFNLGGDPENGEAVMKRALAESPQAIVAVGPRSLVAAMAATERVPIVYCLVPRLDAYDLTAPNVAGVRLEASTADELELVKTVAPAARRVGVVLNPDESKDALDELGRAAKDAGVTIVPIPVRAADETARALAAEEADALLMIPDPTALNLASFTAMVEHAKQQKIPLVALNLRFVERGALVGHVVDYALLGRQVGRLTNAIVDGDTTVEKLGVVDLEGRAIAYSMSTGATIALDAAAMERLMALAAARGTHVQAVK